MKEYGCRRLVRPELHAAYYKGQTRLTAAEQNVFQQTAALPRLDQNAAKCGLGDGPIEATSTARPNSFGACGCSEQPNDPPGQAAGAGFPTESVNALLFWKRAIRVFLSVNRNGITLKHCHR